MNQSSATATLGGIKSTPAQMRRWSMPKNTPVRTDEESGHNRQLFRLGRFVHNSVTRRFAVLLATRTSMSLEPPPTLSPVQLECAHRGRLRAGPRAAGGFWHAGTA